jgi:hypothetical protein
MTDPSDPPRLLEALGTSAQARELLRGLTPPSAPPAAVRAALGSELASMVDASQTAALVSASWVKWAAAGALAVSGVGAAVVWQIKPDPASVPAHSWSAPPRPAVPPPSEHAPAHIASAQHAPAVEPFEAERSRATTKSAGTAPDKSRDFLAEEEALLERARRLVATQPAAALNLLRRHQEQFPRGQLAAERMYLRVDALSRSGDLVGARRELATLVKRYPSSAYARRAPLLLSEHE